MKMLRNKKAIHKMIISLVILILFNFIFPVYSRADWGDFGGALFNPISKLICGIGDAFINILQNQFLPGSPEAVAKKKPIDFIAEQLRENADAIVEQYIASLDEELTEEELEDKRNEMRRKLQEINNRATNAEFASFLSSSKWLWGLAGPYMASINNAYEEQVIPCIIYSPAAIFANMVPALDVNFINPSVIYKGGTIEYDLGSNNVIKVKSYTPNPVDSSSVDSSDGTNSAYVLQSTIATWYKALRNIAIVGLLSVLVYIAIRIILSTTAGETAKYKSMLKDWVVAMCILFFMHYMMAFLLKSSEMLTKLFVSNGVIAQKVEGLKIDGYISNIRSDVEANSGDLGMQFGYTVMYVVLVFYTLIFTWKYIKRLIYLAFLTLMSPLVALTYPIDKIKDGSAQAFNKWFKEYTFNVLIQPIHMLLYTILITSASSLAEDNMIYAIVALGFMLEAEKIIKEFFGLQTQRGEGAGAVTGGAMFGAAAGLMQKGLGLLPGGGSSGGKSGGNSGGNSDGSKPRFNDRNSDSDGVSPFAAFLNDSDDESANITETAGELPGGSNAGGSGTPNVSNPNGSTNPADKYKTKFARTLSRASSKAKNGIKTGARKMTEPIGIVKTGVGDLAEEIGKTRTIKGIKKFGKGAAALGSDIMASPIGRTIKGIGNATWGVGTAAKRFIGRNGIKMAKFAGRTALKGVGAATLGTIGLAAGLASDNDTDILKYSGLGLTAGVTAGGMIGNSAGSMYGTLKSEEEQMQDDFEQGYYRENYEEQALNPRLDKEWEKDKNVQEYYKNHYGFGWRQAMTYGAKVRKSGITDQDDIDRVLKLHKNNEGINLDQATEIVKFAKDYGISKSTMLDSKKRDDIDKKVLKMTNNNPDKAKQIVNLLNKSLGINE